ncbi:Rap guanine nucleotide exchange factor 1 [Hypsibius exemplaris]|uniref:Rap guanine nucleotide exchange factor 1 n=1 Tax=Hypsibius exemplaris TaxID=2072580 RepID=A0A1W0WTA6_HYPEX|nr:Rap guanine nucleotide exchange factor 1 [Hypsibius exemplaris]
MIRTVSASQQSSRATAVPPGKNMDRWSATGDGSHEFGQSPANGSIGSIPPSPGYPWKGRETTTRERRPSLKRTPSFRAVETADPGRRMHLKDLEAISYLEKEAYFALRYLQEIVEKNTQELLAGSTTVVIENMFGLDSHIQNTIHFSCKDDPVIKAESKEVYRYMAVLVHWSDQILLRRTENSVPMRRHNQIVPAIQALRKHIGLLVVQYRKASLLRPATPPSLRQVKQPLSASAESLSPFKTSFLQALPGVGSPSSCDEVDRAVPNDLADLNWRYSPLSARSPQGVPASPADSGSSSFTYNHTQLSPMALSNNGTRAGSISSSISSLHSHSPSPQATSPVMHRNVPSSDDSGISMASSRHRPLDNLPPRPLVRNSSISSLSGRTDQKDLSAVVSSLFPPRCHKNYLRQASLGVEPIYYDNVPQERVPPLPPKKRNVVSYVEVFGQESSPATPRGSNGDIRENRRLFGLPKQLSFDSATKNGSFDRRPSSRPATPELRWYNSERSTADQDLSEELVQILAPFGSDSENETLVRRKANDSNRLYGGQVSLLSSLDCYTKLVYPRTSTGRGELKGGPIDALIVEATNSTKKDFAYQEAFITTYRTFISSDELIDKLMYRYGVFAHSTEQPEKTAARNTFTLLLRVVEELCISEIFRTGLIDILLQFIHKLLMDGELAIARSLRRKILDKHELDWKSRSSSVLLMTPTRRQRRIGYLLDFKSQDLAEQMTLLDAELLSRIELTELLSWTKEQCEDAGLNLSRFTEHFNKVSFWARTRILEQPDQRDREKYFAKFMKIMRCLRKMHNFNSYLAILAAVDSAPVRRLSHSKAHLEALKELGGLIDSSQSFRAYRSALAQIEPPCIPYIGIALQDLTFVNENPDWLDDHKTVVNFGKRYQQYSVLSQLSRFQKSCQYNFQRNESVVQLFNNFDNFMSEEALWQISEAIRPRGAN